VANVPRIAGVDIPNEKRIEYSLQYIYGVGPHLALQILKEAGIEPGVKASSLTEDEVTRIAGVISRSYTVEGQLRRQVQQNIARLKEIGCYRGLRHRRGLPVRGQRTRSNARTRKGPKKTVAGKKGVKEMHRG
jgi:small subunit ribosomal protein S13